MTEDEAWRAAVERYVLGHVADNYCRERIEECLAQTSTIPAAIGLAVEKGGCMLGWWGMSAPQGLQVECMGGFPRTPVSVWIHPHRSRRDEADLVITWREIFEFVRDGYRKVQLSLL